MKIKEMIKILKNKTKYAQSMLEYSLIIALSVLTIIVMQRIYVSHLQGHYKQTTERLGAEKISGQVFGPGGWYGGGKGSYFKEASNWVFSYDNGLYINFGISTGGSRLISRSSITGIKNNRELFIQPKIQPLLKDDKDKEFFELASNQLDIEKIEENLERSNLWDFGHKEDIEKEISDGFDESLKAKASEIIEKKDINQAEKEYNEAIKNYNIASKEKEIEEKNIQYAQKEGYDI
ncbi:MAG: hypothetical protein NC918_06055 [Candidatus Omnitrophica bacterium]|nr:hypothetical protein [Candidatus Omnitrophota bacterium]